MEGNAGLEPTVNTGQGVPNTPPQVDPIQSQPTVAPLSAEDVAKEVQRLMQPQETPVEDVPLTGLFNDTLPEELKGNTAVEGLFTIARSQYPNLDFNKVMGKAWESLDPSQVDVAYLGEIVGHQNAQYYKQYFTSIVDDYATNFTEGLETWAKGVKEQFGGDAGWERVVGTFNSNADQGVVAHVKALLDSPNAQERDIGVSMIRNFVTPYGVIPTQGRTTGGGAVPSSNGGGLTSEQFSSKVAELHIQGKYSEQAVQELRQARLLGVQQGLK